jgi:hypothetical protein
MLLYISLAAELSRVYKKSGYIDNFETAQHFVTFFINIDCLGTYNVYPNNLYLSKISWNERICEIESRFKIVYIYFDTPCIENNRLYNAVENFDYQVLLHI